MKLIKLNAIDSTNLYLKQLVAKNDCEDYTVVQAEYQHEGRGQMGTTWSSDKGKNLIFSVLINFKSFKVQDQFYLSMAISLAMVKVLNSTVKNSLLIKWPNDILAVNDKLAGILIENILGGNGIKKSIIGIGLNVNQLEFPKNIPNVTSLQQLTGHNYNTRELLNKSIEAIKFYVQFVEKKEFKLLKEQYLKYLYKFKIPAMFKDTSEQVFLGKIIDIAEDGRLKIELENEKIRKFNLKEIKFADR
jgi:BirA family biotin operon repressor/biotin-[acetyl-CoA-carboxylase] ligase